MGDAGWSPRYAPRHTGQERTMHHDNGGRVRRGLIGVIGLGSAVTIGVVAFSGTASAQGDDCNYYTCPSTTQKVTTTKAPTTTTMKPTTTTAKATTTTVDYVTTTEAEV